MTELSEIDDGRALRAAKAGDVSILAQRMRDHKPLSDETLDWIADRLEGKAFQKRGPKQSKELQIANIEQYFLFRWLVDVENNKEYVARDLLAKIFSGKPETIRREIDRLKKSPPPAILSSALGCEGDEVLFRETGADEHRPPALRSIFLVDKCQAMHGTPLISVTPSVSGKPCG